MPAIIHKVKDQCQLIWLENLNLRGSYKTVILDYIKEKHPELFPLYQEIYNQGESPLLGNAGHRIKSLRQ